MSTLRSLSRAITATLLLGSAHIAAADTISISGAVLKPGTYQWHADARLHDATVAGQVRADAWFLGAALLRQSALEPQQRLKAGVLFELRVNRLHARTENNPALYTLLEDFTQQVQDMPVTGRVPAELNPLQLMIPSRILCWSPVTSWSTPPVPIMCACWELCRRPVCCPSTYRRNCAITCVSARTMRQRTRIRYLLFRRTVAYRKWALPPGMRSR